MLSFLIAIGRYTVVIAAVCIIISSTVSGYFYALTWQYSQGLVDVPDSVSVFEVIGTVLGFAAGVILSGSVLGLMAAVFDIQRSIKAFGIMNYSAVISSTVETSRVEPKFYK